MNTKTKNALFIGFILIMILNIFMLGRVYQIKKDTKTISTIQEQFEELSIKYKDLIEHSVYIK